MSAYCRSNQTATGPAVVICSLSVGAPRWPTTWMPYPAKLSLRVCHLGSDGTAVHAATPWAKLVGVECRCHPERQPPGDQLRDPPLADRARSGHRQTCRLQVGGGTVSRDEHHLAAAERSQPGQQRPRLTHMTTPEPGCASHLLTVIGNEWVVRLAPLVARHKKRLRDSRAEAKRLDHYHPVFAMMFDPYIRRHFRKIAQLVLSGGSRS